MATINISEPLRDRLKIYAANKRMKLGDIVERILESTMNRVAPREKNGSKKTKPAKQ